MGPTCQVSVKSDDGATLDTIDAALIRAAERVERTRKGRVWNVWIDGRPAHVTVSGAPPFIALSAGGNDLGDYDMLRNLAEKLAEAVDGVASEPTK